MKDTHMIKLFGETCKLTFGRYMNDGVALQASTLDDEPFATLTVNWEAHWEGANDYSKAFPFPAIVVKNYSENEGVVDELEREGVIEQGGAYLSGSDGGVMAKLLTPKWQAIAAKQLEELEQVEA